MIVSLYSDGSYLKGKSSWAFIIVNDKGKILFKDRGLLNGRINKLNQVAGEIFGLMKGIEYCIVNNYLADIYIDFSGLIRWIDDLFGNTPWRCKNEWTKDYREFMFKNKHIINSISKVKSHSNNHFNDIVDDFAKMQ